MRLKIEMSTNARAGFWESLLGAVALYVIYHLISIAQ
jgi:hypothetical protein